MLYSSTSVLHVPPHAALVQSCTTCVQAGIWLDRHVAALLQVIASSDPSDKNVLVITW